MIEFTTYLKDRKFSSVKILIDEENVTVDKITYNQDKKLVEALLRSAFLTYHPFKLIEPVGQAEELPKSVREMARYAERKSKAFVCSGKSCSTPLYTPEALTRTLSTAR